LANVLLVEDNAGDRRLFREALLGIELVCALHTVVDGAQALAFLRRQGEYDTAPRPDLIVLDLNLPKKNGREVLAEIKAEPMLSAIPVLILTTSDFPRDKIETSGANCFLTKSLDVEHYFASVRTALNSLLCAHRV